jgi:hypothetical protein
MREWARGFCEVGVSYSLLSETRPIARKDHRCIWCGQKIEKGLFKPANAAVTREREAEAVGTVPCGQATP